MNHQANHDQSLLNFDSEQVIFDAENIPSAVLTRLIEEVRTETLSPATAYNRVHNRHNRGH